MRKGVTTKRASVTVRKSDTLPPLQAGLDAKPSLPGGSGTGHDSSRAVSKQSSIISSALRTASWRAVPSVMRLGNLGTSARRVSSWTAVMTWGADFAEGAGGGLAHAIGQVLQGLGSQALSAALRSL